MKFSRIRRVSSGLIATFVLLFCFAAARAQTRPPSYVPPPLPTKKEYERPRDLQVLSEEPDGKGNIVRVIQYKQGMMKVTETIIMPRKQITGLNMAINPDTLLRDSLMVMVNKSKYNVQVYYRKRLIRSYKATFGPQPMQNKCMEGDRCTPEGWFKITNKNGASKFNKFLGISYPNDSATVRFNRLKAQGLVPATARIGGDIGIHGIWQGGDNMIELGVGWTDGCVALKNKDVEELFSIVGVGTRVFISK